MSLTSKVLIQNEDSGKKGTNLMSKIKGLREKAVVTHTVLLGITKSGLYTYFTLKSYS